jgi:hypothetical protein
MVNGHGIECVVIARAHVRALRAAIRLNESIIEAYNRNQEEIEEIVAYLERRITDADPRDLIYLTPHRLQRQTNRQFDMFNSSSSSEEAQ